MPPGVRPLPPLVRAFLVVGLFLMVVATLHFGARIIVPVVEAVVVCFVLNAVAGAIRRVPVVGRRVPHALALVAAALLAFALGFWAMQASLRAATTMGPQAAGFRQAVGPIVEALAAWFGISGRELLDRFVDMLGVEAALRYVVAATVATISHFGIVAIYVAFLLVDQQFFDRKLRALVPDDARRASIRGLLDRVTRGIQTYLWIMTFVSFLTAVMSYGVMRLAGMEYAVFLATAIFFLNYIPTIGSIIGTVLPVAFALLQFQQAWPAALVLIGVGAIQVVIGNVVLPRIAGGALNIGLAVTMLALFSFGALWGVTGMFVAMPLTAMLIITFSHFDATRPYAILLSRTGELELPDDD